MASQRRILGIPAWFLFVFGLIVPAFSWGQAGIQPMTYSPEQAARWQQIQDYRAWHKPTKKASTTKTQSLSLPFLDDFSKGEGLPDSSKWKANSGVFINNRLSIDPPSIGIASFDGNQANGLPYNTNLKAKGPCDTLTSLPIDLSGLPGSASGTVLLTFYLQSGHQQVTVFRPDSTDSLIVQLLNPATTLWSNALVFKGGSQDFSWHYQYLAIPDSLFQDKFQFRFLNYGFQNGTFNLFNIDYVYLDVDRVPGDSGIADVAMTGNLQGYFRGFRSIPVDHYNRNSRFSVLDSSVQAKVINRSPNLIVFDELRFTADSLDGNGKFQPASLAEVPFSSNPLAGIGDISPNFFFEKANQEALATLRKGQPFAETGTFRYQLLFGIKDSKFNSIRTNDTLSSIATLADYYAHDDGDGEVLEYVVGNFASMVVKINPLDTGRLTGLALYFDPLSFQVNPTLTGKIVVYKKLKGINGAVQDTALYSSSISLISNGGKWYFFPLSHPVFVGPGPYYVGYRQDIGDDNRLYIRTDINSSQGDIFVNFSGTWGTDSILVGHPMIRPYYQCAVCPVATKPIYKRLSLKAWPNPVPAGQQLKLEGKFISASLVSSEGKVININLEQTEGFSYASIPASMPLGLYTLKAVGRQGIGYVRLVVE